MVSSIRMVGQVVYPIEDSTLITTGGAVGEKGMIMARYTHPPKLRQ
jgi:hypothetical protein